jgi:hypothetical protein
MVGPIATAAPVMSPPLAGPGGRPAKFNAAPPPATIYSAEVALAAAAQAVEAANRAKHGVQCDSGSCTLPVAFVSAVSICHLG